VSCERARARRLGLPSSPNLMGLAPWCSRHESRVPYAWRALECTLPYGYKSLNLVPESSLNFTYYRTNTFSMKLPHLVLFDRAAMLVFKVKPTPPPPAIQPCHTVQGPMGYCGCTTGDKHRWTKKLWPSTKARQTLYVTPGQKIEVVREESWTVGSLRRTRCILWLLYFLVVNDLRLMIYALRRIMSNPRICRIWLCWFVCKRQIKEEGSPWIALSTMYTRCSIPIYSHTHVCTATAMPHQQLLHLGLRIFRPLSLPFPSFWNNPQC
jgi:hypothetical protein